MATLTIRKIPDEQIQQLKEVAEKNTAPWNLRCDPFLKMAGWHGGA